MGKKKKNGEIKDTPTNFVAKWIHFRPEKEEYDKEQELLHYSATTCQIFCLLENATKLTLFPGK